MRFVIYALIIFAGLGLASCKQQDPRNTCGPKVPLEECIK